MNCLCADTKDQDILIVVPLLLLKFKRRERKFNFTLAVNVFLPVSNHYLGKSNRRNNVSTICNISISQLIVTLSLRIAKSLTKHYFRFI